MVKIPKTAYKQELRTKQGSKTLDILSAGIAGFFEGLMERIIIPLHREANAFLDNFLDKFENRIVFLQAQALKFILSALMIGLAMILLIAAFVSYLLEYHNWSMAGAFFAGGVVILALAMILGAVRGRKNG